MVARNEKHEGPIRRLAPHFVPGLRNFRAYGGFALYTKFIADKDLEGAPEHAGTEVAPRRFASISIHQRSLKSQKEGNGAPMKSLPVFNPWARGSTNSARQIVRFCPTMPKSFRSLRKLFG